MASLRLGLIGYGAWGSHHARAIAAVDDAELVAIAGHTPASCDRAASEHPKCRVENDYRQLLDDPRIDAVDVVLPSHLHFEVAADVLRSGKHLLLEKPMTLCIDECSQLIELAKAERRLLAVGHELRLSSLWGRVKELIDEGAIGEPCYCLIELWRNPYRLGSDGWRYDLDRVGSWILEEPIHFFDLARWYFSAAGEPQTVFARASSRQPDRPELHDNFSAMVTFAGGQYAVISQTLAGWEHHQVAKITGTTGALWASWSGATDRTFEPTFSLRVQRGGQPADEPIARPSGEVYELVDEIKHFVNSVQTGAPLPCTGEDGRWSVAMCLKAEEALRTGQPVALGDF
ncbi:MAG: Gfo/Idh/MocA family protein [Pirellulales bacterium]